MQVSRLFATKKIDPWKEAGAVFTVYSGGVNLLEPDPDTIDVRDIALGMDRIVRYNGQTRDGITVGEHCINFSEWCADVDLKIHCLLHDAAEAYIGDIVSPLKVMLPELTSIERRLISAIYRKLQLDEPDWEFIHKLESTFFPLDFHRSQLKQSTANRCWLDHLLNAIPPARLAAAAASPVSAVE